MPELSRLYFKPTRCELFLTQYSHTEELYCDQVCRLIIHHTLLQPDWLDFFFLNHTGCPEMKATFGVNINLFLCEF